MAEFVFLNGEIVDSRNANINIKDLAILRGYGIFDYMRTVSGKMPFMMDKHLDRFYNSAGYMNLPVEYEREKIKNIIFDLLKINNNEEQGISLVLTGGYSLNSFQPSKPNFFIVVEALHFPAREYYENGARLISHLYQREWCQAKTINYLTSVRLLDKMKNQGALEILYHANGSVLEASRSNFFLVKDNVLVTPEKDILQGITRGIILDLAPGICTIERRTIDLEELAKADETFITGTTKKILPIIQIDDLIIGNGKPGPVTQQLMTRFLEYEKNYQD